MGCSCRMWRASALDRRTKLTDDARPALLSFRLKVSLGLLAPWHSSQDFCSAFVATVIQVNELAAGQRNAFAHFHGRLALRAQERMSD
jgi:hypothetical protein